MANVFDVAKYFLNRIGPMSTWKLHKLCYYAQAWTLAWDEEELFSEEFEAWSNGPVCRPLFRAHKGLYMIRSDQLLQGDEAALTPSQRENLDIIIRDYGDKEAYWLKEQTHHEEPWILARNGLPVGAPCDTVITKESMGLYYGGL